MKLIRHNWKRTGYLQWECQKCGCVKKQIKIGVEWYFRNGKQLATLPECKTVFHNDKIG